MEGGVAGAGEGGVFVYGPFEARIDERDVGDGSHGERAAVDLDQAGRVDGVELDEAWQIDDFLFVNEDV